MNSYVKIIAEATMEDRAQKREDRAMRAKALLEEQAQKKSDREIRDLYGVIALHVEFGEHAEANEKKKKLMEILSTPLLPVVMPAVPEVLDVGKGLDGKDDGGARDVRKDASHGGNDAAGSARMSPERSSPAPSLGGAPEADGTGPSTSGEVDLGRTPQSAIFL